MKKPSSGILGLVLAVLVGIGVYMLAPLMKAPQFVVINTSQQAVDVYAYWRNKQRALGAIQPLDTYLFSVKDEAAMRFEGHLPDGRTIQSTEIYFTGGSKVIATLTETGIQVKYEHEP